MSKDPWPHVTDAQACLARHIEAAGITTYSQVMKAFENIMRGKDEEYYRKWIAIWKAELSKINEIQDQ